MDTFRSPTKVSVTHRLHGMVRGDRGTCQQACGHGSTCALDEDNYANNAVLAQALAAQSYPVEFHAARGGHDWPTWRRALESHLPTLLRKAWR